MYKTVETGSWKYDEPRVMEIPRSCHGFGTNDMRKLAMRLDPELQRKIDDLTWKEGEVPIHLIAIGADEAYGPNRNGDAFTKEACRRWHHTFAKYARFYRNHKATDPEKSYGVVKCSHFNEKMQRIELVCGLNGTEKTARENGGLLADKELQKLGNDQDVPVSMGTFVPYDVCSTCGHEAPSPKDYCGEECPRGGRRTKVGALLEGGAVARALNPICRFTDISHIVDARQADRIAYVTGVLKNAAESGQVLFSADLAALYGAEMPVHPIALKLAAVRTLEPSLLNAFCGRAPITVPTCTTEELKLATAAMADAGVILPADQFVRLLGGTNPALQQQVKTAAADVFHGLVVPHDNPFSHRGSVPLAWQKWALNLSAGYSLSDKAIVHRLHERAMSGQSAALLQKVAGVSSDPLVDELAEQYGYYVVASMERIHRQGLESPLTPLGVYIQNQTR